MGAVQRGHYAAADGGFYLAWDLESRRSACKIAFITNIKQHEFDTVISD